MKSLIQVVAVAAVLAVPAVSFAQQSNKAPVTRAQVRAELVQLEKAGYQPSRDDPYYPANIQAAEARVAAQNGATSGYGGSVSSSSASGAPAVMAPPPADDNGKSLYFGH